MNFGSGLRLEENADSQTYPVLISFKDTVDFDGKARHRFAQGWCDRDTVIPMKYKDSYKMWALYL